MGRNLFFNRACRNASARGRLGRPTEAILILAIEPTWTGTIHAPGNSTLLDIAKLAFPGQRLSIYGDAGHLQEMQSLLNAKSGVQFRPIELSPAFRHKPHIVSFKRLLKE